MDDEVNQYEVKGFYAPTPKITKIGLLYALIHVGLPVMTIALLVDVVLYMIFTIGFDRCYGLMCLFE